MPLRIRSIPFQTTTRIEGNEKRIKDPRSSTTRLVRMKNVFKGHKTTRAKTLSITTIVLLILLVLSCWMLMFHTNDENVPNDSKKQEQQQHILQLFEENSYMAPICHAFFNRDEIHFTLVTHAIREDQLWMIEYQCQLWNGPISLVVYTKRSLSKIQRMVQEKYHCPVLGWKSFNTTTRTTRSTVTVQVLSPNDGTKATTTTDTIESNSQNIHHDDPNDDEDCPVNAIRNLALQVVQTSHVVIVDIDYWISDELYEQLHSSLIRRAFYKDDKLALVIPAFQVDGGIDFCYVPTKKHGSSYTIQEQQQQRVDCRNKMIDTMPRTKQDINNGLQKRVLMGKENKVAIYQYLVQPYQIRKHPHLHGSTDYTDWYVQAPGTMKLISCVKSNLYEPIIAIRYCYDMPPFQTIFTTSTASSITAGGGAGAVGDGGSDGGGGAIAKSSWIVQLRKVGYIFYQVGGIFVVKFPYQLNKQSDPIVVAHNSQRKVSPGSAGREFQHQRRREHDISSYWAKLRSWLKHTYGQLENHNETISTTTTIHNPKHVVNHNTTTTTANYIFPHERTVHCEA